MIAEVVVDVLNKQVNKTFDYLIPSYLEDVIKIGHRVKILFARRLITGFVTDVKNTSTYKKKLNPILDIIDVKPILNEEFVNIGKYIAENNFSYYALALQTMIPQAMKIKYQKVAKCEVIPDELKDIFKNRKEICIDNRSPEELKLLYNAYTNGIISIETKFKKVRNEKKIEYIYVENDTITPKSKQGQAILDYLLECGCAMPINEVVEESGYSKNSIKTLIENKILGTYEEELLFEDEKEYPVYEIKELNDIQKNVFNKVIFNQNKTYLLHGVTGSGKTMVYINWIKEAIKSGKEALMLVPEISLTPQITAILKGCFKDDIAIIHSRLSISQKYSAWKKIINKEVKIVVGARSAIFAPLTNLGIIIIDEEHESSYRQENNPKYNAIDIAKIRSSNHNCPLVLASATPDVCDYYKALNDEYELLNMPFRVNNNPLPKKEIIDMTIELKEGNKSVFSRCLKNKIVEAYKKKEQIILFLNRRGYSSFVMCRNCGEVIKCPHCDISLTFHASTNTLKCHHCGYSRLNVSNCTSCGSSKIRFVGSGTEKVMEEINNLLPEAKVLRADLDSAKKLTDYEKIFEKFKNHEADILVGTQMIAKGLDFTDVTLVGIINADLAINYPSYDANMKAFNLIEQVSGRAGRHQKQGEVIVQTYNPEHFVIKCSKNNDYLGFYEKEINNRKITDMPPFSFILELMFISSNQSLAYNEALNMLYSLKKEAKESIILGPAEGLPFKINDQYRYLIQVKIKENVIKEKIKEIYPIYQSNKDVDLKINIL